MAFFRHVLLPSGAIAFLVAAYADPRWRDLVAPERREVGLLELLQVALLVATLAILAIAACRRRPRLQRWLLVGFAAGVLFLLLEETDYGFVYSGRSWNVHTGFGVTGALKVVADVLVFALFFVVPLVLRRPRTRWMRFLRPGRWYAASVAAMVTASKVAHHFVDRIDGPHPLRGNVSEFRELFFYYILLLYAWDLASPIYSWAVRATDARRRLFSLSLPRRRAHDRPEDCSGRGQAVEFEERGRRRLHESRRGRETKNPAVWTGQNRAARE